jgi:hypothetical protein
VSVKILRFLPLTFFAPSFPRGPLFPWFARYELVSTPVTHPDADSREEGLWVKIVKGVLSVGVHSTPFFTS